MNRIAIPHLTRYVASLARHGSCRLAWGQSAVLAGKPVQGGLIGSPLDLARLDEAGDPYFTTDFRDVDATLLRRWLAVDPEPILGRRNSAPTLIEAGR
jgi:uncharacterized protein (DUF1501 family)